MIEQEKDLNFYKIADAFKRNNIELLMQYFEEGIVDLACDYGYGTMFDYAILLNNAEIISVIYLKCQQQDCKQQNIVSADKAKDKLFEIINSYDHLQTIDEKANSLAIFVAILQFADIDLKEQFSHISMSNYDFDITLMSSLGGLLNWLKINCQFYTQETLLDKAISIYSRELSNVMVEYINKIEPTGQIKEYVSFDEMAKQIKYNHNFFQFDNLVLSGVDASMMADILSTEFDISPSVVEQHLKHHYNY